MAATTPNFQANCSLQLNAHHMIRLPTGEDLRYGKLIYPKDLSIAWGEDSRYWNVPKDGSPAELKRVCWLEVTCCVQNTKPDKEYDIGFNLSLTPDAFGWDDSPVFLLVRRGRNGKLLTLGRYDLDGVERGVSKNMTVRVGKSEQTCKILEDSELYFVMYEVWAGKWKGGLKVNHAFIIEVA